LSKGKEKVNYKRWSDLEDHGEKARRCVKGGRTPPPCSRREEEENRH
jgi:hypothetical protein